MSVCVSTYQYYIHIQYFNDHAVAMANFTFIPAFHPYRYVHRLLLDDWNLCSCIQCTRSIFLNNRGDGSSIHSSLTGPMLVVAERRSATMYIAKYSYQLAS